MKRLNEHLRAIILTAGFATLAVLAAGAILPQDAEADHRSRREPLAQCRSQLRSASYELRKTERDLAHYKQAYENLAARAQDRRRDLRRDRRQDRRRAQQHDHQEHGMSQRNFSRFYTQFKDVGVSSRRLDLMRRAVRNGRFSVDQLVSLLAVCNFDSTRIKIAAMVYPTVVDRANWVGVYGSFSFSSSGRTLDRKLGLAR